MFFHVKNNLFNFFKEVNVMYKIDPELCTACGSCKEECPEDAIVEGDDFYTITDKCVDCGSCVEVCPVDAISEG